MDRKKPTARADKAAGNADAKKKAAEKPAKKKARKLVIVGEGSYLVFGPFSRKGVEAHLKSHGFVHAGQDVWTNKNNNARVLVREVKRPEAPKVGDRPIVAFTRGRAQLL